MAWGNDAEACKLVEDGGSLKEYLKCKDDFKKLTNQLNKITQFV